MIDKYNCKWFRASEDRFQSLIVRSGVKKTVAEGWAHSTQSRGAAGSKPRRKGCPPSKEKVFFAALTRVFKPKAHRPTAENGAPLWASSSLPLDSESRALTTKPQAGTMSSYSARVMRRLRGAGQSERAKAALIYFFSALKRAFLLVFGEKEGEHRNRKARFRRFWKNQPF